MNNYHLAQHDGIILNENETVQPTIQARFQIQLPDHLWIAEVSQRFPDATFRLLTGVQTATGSTELGEVISDDPAEVSNAISEYPAVLSHQVLDVTENRSLARYETSQSNFFDFVENSSLAPEFPITVQDGWFEFDLTAKQERFDLFQEGLEASPHSFELVSKIQFVESPGLLTERQEQVVETALREGYFEIPRESTLAEVAEKLGVDKSSASEVLRRAEANILKWYLTSPSD